MSARVPFCCRIAACWRDREEVAEAASRERAEEAEVLKLNCRGRMNNAGFVSGCSSPKTALGPGRHSADR